MSYAVSNFRGNITCLRNLTESFQTITVLFYIPVDIYGILLIIIKTTLWPMFNEHKKTEYLEQPRAAR